MMPGRAEPSGSPFSTDSRGILPPGGSVVIICHDDPFPSACDLDDTVVFSGDKADFFR
jgi:hypothetical protein